MPLVYSMQSCIYRWLYLSLPPSQINTDFYWPLFSAATRCSPWRDSQDESESDEQEQPLEMKPLRSSAPMFPAPLGYHVATQSTDPPLVFVTPFRPCTEDSQEGWLIRLGTPMKRRASFVLAEHLNNARAFQPQQHFCLYPPRKITSGSKFSGMEWTVQLFFIRTVGHSDA
jgi:hypothetical protein